MYLSSYGCPSSSKSIKVTLISQAERGLGSHFTGGHLATQDISRSRKDCGPICKSGIGHASALAICHQICEGSVQHSRIWVSRRFEEMSTFALLGEEKIGFRGRRQIRNTVSSVQKDRALSVRQCGIGLDFQRLVVAKVAGE
jgi:hypothetical protein